ncbi:MAG: hypothetical protein N3D84_02120 [Candidatus Woesearchaeota archaeon]|nr:hypothetical protein [Candidatus Woesearchaeota archaeon]
MALFGFFKKKKAEIPPAPSPSVSSASGAQLTQQPPQTTPPTPPKPFFEIKKTGGIEEKEAELKKETEELEFPVFPALVRPEEEKEIKPRVVDDFGFLAEELPEIEAPKFIFPKPTEKKEVEEAIKSIEELKKPEAKRFEEIPEEIPELKKAPVKIEKPKEAEEAFIEEEEIKEPPKVKGPFFVSLSNFNLIRSNLNSMANSIKYTEVNFMKLNELVNKQDNDLKIWHSLFETAQKKMMYIDKMLFEKQKKEKV